MITSSSKKQNLQNKDFVVVVNKARHTAVSYQEELENLWKARIKAKDSEVLQK